MSIIDIAVKRPVTVWMFTIAILLFGMVSLSRLAINLLPELSYPTLTIRTDYVGAAPGEVEQLVSKPIEEAIGVVKGVRSVKSTSRAGQSDVILEFEWGTEMDLASLEVREKLDILQLPLDVTKPLLLRFNPSLDPVMRYGLGGALPDPDADDSQTDENAQLATIMTSMDAAGMKRLRTYAEEQIKRKLESVEGVASVKVGGGLENEIQVLINQQKTSQLNITISEIVTRLQQENVNTSGGRVEDGSQEYLVRTLNQFETLDDILNLFIATRNGRHIRLGDIAQVEDSHKERTSVTRFEGFEGVEIAIYKEGDANTVQVAENVKRRLERINEDIPSQYKMQLVYDQSTFIGSAINEVKSAAIVGGLLAMLVLYLFLKNIWPTFIISISIPVSIIATFNLMYGNGISLNIMSLGGIALAIGLLVDNSIVVLENIDRHKKQQKDIKTAANKGTKEVAMAIVASTLTTMAVFFPLVFVEGIAGQLFGDQALTVTFALGASLLVAMTIIPMLASREKPQGNLLLTDGAAQESDDVDLSVDEIASQSDSKINKIGRAVWWPFKMLFRGLFYYIPLALTSVILLVFRSLQKALGFIMSPFLWGFDKGYTAINRGYQSLLAFSLKQRAIMVSAIVVLSLGSLTLVNKLGVELIPPMAQGEFFVELTLPTGARLDTTDTVLSELAAYTETLPQVERSYSLAGTGNLMNASPGQGGDYWGKLNVVLKEGMRAEDELAAKAAMREYLKTQAGVQSKFGKPELFSFSTPLEIELVGYDLGMLRRYGEQVVELLEANDRFADVKSSLQSGNPELKIHFDHAKLAQLGLSSPDVAQLVAAKIGGEIASKYSINDRKVDILVRTQEAQRDSAADVAQIIVNPGATRPITLDAVAEIVTSIGPSEITRMGQERVAIISANLAYGDLGEAVIDAQKIIPELNLPLSMQAKVAGQNEEMEVSFQSLKFALALAIFMVYLVMASQFESLLHPFIILFTVPLACAGSIYGLYLTGTTVSVVVFIGLIMLAGIVVNNAIVLVDRINQLREQGVEKLKAIREAAENRFRPILMTTLTTTLGLLPMMLGFGEGAEIRKPMAITVIFGLMYATLLTLFLIPVLYSIFDRKRFLKSVHESSTDTNGDAINDTTVNGNAGA